MQSRSLLAVCSVLVSAVPSASWAQQFQSADRLAQWRGTYSQDSRSVSVGDVNADGHDDIVMLCDAMTDDATEAQLWLGGVGGPVGPISVPGLPRIVRITTTATVNAAAPITQLKDLDADGAADFIVITPADAQVWMSEGDGTFTFSQSVAGAFLEVQTLDVTRDGRPDVLLRDNSRLLVMRNASGVLEQLGSTVGVGPHTQSMVFGRLGSGPGPDLSIGSGRLLNNGTGLFTSGANWSEAWPVHLVDLNADGISDPIGQGFTTSTPPALNLILPWWIKPVVSASGLHSYIPTTGWTANFPMPFNGPYRTTSLPPGNTHGAEFIVYGVMNTAGSKGAESAQLALVRRVGGTLQADPAIASGGIGLRSVHAGDFDADGCLDLVTLNNGTAVWLLSNGNDRVDRTFGSGLILIRGDCTVNPPRFQVSSAAGEATFNTSDFLMTQWAGDLDGDGLPELAVNRSAFPTAYTGVGTNGGTGYSLVFRNLGGRFDFTKPLHLIGSDTTPFTARWTVLDLNGDGVRELYTTTAAGFARFNPVPISNAPLALPQFWDQAYALSASLIPVYNYPLPTTNYSASSGNGTFSPADNLMRFDADGDGSSDLVFYENYRNLTVGGPGPSRITVRRDDGSEIRSETPVRMTAVSAIDFDGDGDTDIIGIEWPGPRESGAPPCGCYSWSPTDFCECRGPTRLMLLSNDGLGGFSASDPVMPFPAVSDPLFGRRSILRTTDVTGDRVPDLVAIHPPLSQIFVYPGGSQGLATFSLVSSIGPAGPVGLNIAELHDLDRDGNLDYVFAMSAHNVTSTEMVFPDQIGVAMNDGTGRFIPTQSGPHILGTLGVSAADLDGDRDADLVYADIQSLLTISLNRTPAPPCPADFNSDALVSTPDLTFFLGRFGQPVTPGSLAARADFDSSGSVDMQDLVHFLGRFGSRCP